jgi:Galactose oxidase, central domain/Kelch motif
VIFRKEYNMKLLKLRSVGLLAISLITITVQPALASGTFQKTGSMNVAREGHTCTLLSNGEALVAGGGNGTAGYLSSAELYNPATGTWTLTGSMNVPGESHQAVRLQNGQVLVAGGDNASGALASAELYNPSTGNWTTTGSMITVRSGFTLTLLPNGEVLAAQGTSAELYNPATGTWTATGSPTGTVGGPNAALLQDSEVLAIGESINTPSELYNPSTGIWSATGSTGTTIINPITPRLLNGEVFVTGGFQSGNRSYSTAALYAASSLWKPGRAVAERLMARCFKQARSWWRGELSLCRATRILHQKRLIPLSFGTFQPRHGRALEI